MTQDEPLSPARGSGPPSAGVDEKRFWNKLRRYAKTAGRGVVEKALLFWYAFQKEETPTWAKGVILGALAYFISPIDAIPDLTPILGYTDDLGVLAAAMVTVARYIDDDVKRRAHRKLAGWFGEDGAPAEVDPSDALPPKT